MGEQEPSEQWGPSERLGAYDAEAIRRLKDDTDGTIYISGSGELVRGLLADGLVDELHLFVYPIALGEGERLFTEGSGPTKLALLASDVYANGVVHLSYGPAAPDADGGAGMSESAASRAGSTSGTASR